MISIKKAKITGVNKCGEIDVDKITNMSRKSIEIKHRADKDERTRR